VQVGMTKLTCTPFVAACTLTPSPKQQYFAGNGKKGKGGGGGCTCTTYVKLQKVPWPSIHLQQSCSLFMILLYPYK
jgi:hypothetical protein